MFEGYHFFFFLKIKILFFHWKSTFSYALFWILIKFLVISYNLTTVRDICILPLKQVHAWKLAAFKEEKKFSRALIFFGLTVLYETVKFYIYEE